MIPPAVRSDHLVDGPGERLDAHFLVSEVQFLDSLEKRCDFVFGHDAEHRGVHLRPGMCASTRVTGRGAPTLHVLEERETTDPEHVEHILDALGIGLVEYYHYCFQHNG